MGDDLMTAIEITLFPNKRSKTAWAQNYAVVEGEDGVTEIAVRFPESYASSPLVRLYVYMKNAKGEYAVKELDWARAEKSFSLPASMTFAGTTTLVFYAESKTEKAVWLPIEIPIAATSVDYKEVARASPDILQEAIKATEEIREFLKQQKG